MWRRSKFEPSTVFNNDDLIRIILLGKTGSGKSATGNTILRNKVFESYFSPESLTTCCKKIFAELDGQKVAVIDTPGLFDTRTDEETTTKNISQCIAYASPGPHVFLVVVQLGKFTEEEKQTIQKIQEIFGADADKYSLVLFTHGDKLEGTTIKTFLNKSRDLQELVAKCNGQYHVFNNKEEEEPSQITELLKKIRDLNERNGGSYYTNEMFQKAERAIEEKKQQILREKAEQMRQEEEKIKREIKEEYEQRLREVKGDIEQERQIMAEQQNETDKEIENLRRILESQARQGAEGSSSVIGLLVGVCGAVASLASLYVKYKKLTV